MIAVDAEADPAGLAGKGADVFARAGGLWRSSCGSSVRIVRTDARNAATANDHLIIFPGVGFRLLLRISLKSTCLSQGYNVAAAIGSSRFQLELLAVISPASGTAK